MEGYATASQWGLMSPNQIAKLEDWSPIPGGDSTLRPLTHIATSELDKRGMTFDDAAKAAFLLVRAGYEPAAVNEVLGLPPIAHTGLVPVTIQVDPSAVPASSRNGSNPVGATP